MKSSSEETLITKRFRLRILNLNDVGPHYVSWLNDPEVNRYLESRYHSHTIDTTIKYVNECHNDPQIFSFAIFERNSDLHIGNIKIVICDEEKKVGQIGILIGEKSYWGQGVATEVIKALLNFGFEILNLREIVAGCYRSNVASLKAFIKSGFSIRDLCKDSHQLDGVSEDSYILSLGIDDYSLKV